eukprot:TRINITY_DN959_c0_g1_i1.p1 TRINITY_DN959_c0_g1~~TRINITY_DN959_c0_g1_i1.p1  ORF type:complete len:692 (-),score=114.27 TRINITY_DN959_c0_g1_i1:51-1970(-)
MEAPKHEFDESHQDVTYPSKLDVKRSEIESLLKRRFFIAPAFGIYGGVRGLYDYGPPGCAVKTNLLDTWRQHYVLEESMLEVDCSCLTPEPVLKASGHVAKFSDFMVKEEGTGNCYRADHLLEDHLEKLLEDKSLSEAKRLELETENNQAGEYNGAQLKEAFARYGILSPEGKPLSDPEPFNLMFSTTIGPGDGIKGYLRPETAQGIFVNFKRLLEYNGGKLPFAAAQIGSAYRNEIAPRSGVLRVREFQMAEIEHFVKADSKDFAKFANVANLKVFLFPRKHQLEINKHLECTLGFAVKHRIIDNETLAYYIGRTYLFLRECGVKAHGVRFRQHLSNEMAHYASDCWDAELLTSYGWVECVGIADRSCFDLSNHSEKSNEQLVAYETYAEPRIKQGVKITPDKKAIGPALKGDAKAVYEFFETLASDKALILKDELAAGQATITLASGKQVTIQASMVKIEQAQIKVSGETFYPHVIEPSFGIGRIIYSILEQNYYVRQGSEQRAVLSLPARIAPTKCSVLPLRQKAEFTALVPEISLLLTSYGLTHKVDTTGQTIGKRYARTDEIGVPFGITIDSTTVEDRTVTLRERDTMSQIRVPIAEVGRVVQDIVQGRTTWQAVLESNKYPVVATSEDDEKEK